jgi:2-aminoethylphosphonate-pyruvate transaminase
MEERGGKWRFTSPTHVVRAFAQAMKELEGEGGVEARYRRYRANHRVLVEGMHRLGFACLLPDEHQSPIITSFLSPEHPLYTFDRFYQALKARGFVIYPGKVTTADTFRIGNIGDLYPEDMRLLIEAVGDCMFWGPSQPRRDAATSSVSELR